MDSAKIWTLLGMVLMLYISLSSSVPTEVTKSEEPMIDCELDDDAFNEELEKCYQKADVFIDKYTKYIRSKKKRKHSYDKCQGYDEFKQCVKPLEDNCPTIRQKVQHRWRAIDDLLTCACAKTDTKTECQNQLQCFEREFSGTMVKYCDTFYKFNVRQKTRNKCSFAHDNVKCKEALVESACGAEAGKFAFHFAKLSSRHHLKHGGSCSKQQGTSYEAFRYTADCPANITELVTKCDKRHIKDSELYFFDVNDLVVDGKKKDIQTACRDYNAYNQCIRDVAEKCPRGLRMIYDYKLAEKCPRGLRMIYDYKQDLRKYLLKADFICGKAKPDYTKNMQCYKHVLGNETLQQCIHIWNSLKPDLQSISSYEFFCEDDMEITQRVAAQLNSLIGCYARVFNHSCGQTGSDVMKELMTLAFKDPYYLDFEYKPHCAAHKEDLTSTSLTPPNNNRTMPPRQRSSDKTVKPLIDSKKENQSSDKRDVSYEVGDSGSRLLLSIHVTVLGLLCSWFLGRR